MSECAERADDEIVDGQETPLGQHGRWLRQAEVARLREERDRLSADFNQLLANQDALSGHLLKRDAQIARLRAYVQHRGDCVFAPQVLASTRRRICTCGLDAALAGPAESRR